MCKLEHLIAIYETLYILKDHFPTKSDTIEAGFLAQRQICLYLPYFFSAKNNTNFPPILQISCMAKCLLNASCTFNQMQMTDQRSCLAYRWCYSNTAITGSPEFESHDCCTTFILVQIYNNNIPRQDLNILQNSLQPT